MKGENKEQEQCTIQKKLYSVKSKYSNCIACCKKKLKEQSVMSKGTAKVDWISGNASIEANKLFSDKSELRRVITKANSITVFSKLRKTSKK